MCGIVGIIHKSQRPIDPAELERMNDALSHRGPDGAGTTCRDQVGLGHRRLAIIDPALGQQPIFNDDESVALTFNGEVYNYVELRRELEGRFEFRTQSDTEVVLRAYEAWGIDCITRFRGMFALAIHDARTRTVHIVRDRAGIKPLYFFESDDRLLFASELQALLQSDGLPRQLDPAALSGFFRYQYVPAPLSIYQGVQKLRPGHRLEMDLTSGRTATRCYWELPVGVAAGDAQKSEAEWLEELDALLDDIIDIYVRSDVPFGAFLSGGMDSSIVTALMARRLRERVHTFTIGFAEEEHSELPFARQAAEVVGTVHHEKVVSPDLAEATLATLARHFGEPFSDSSAVPTFYVSRAAADNVKMVLSGDGGDELFAGYNSYLNTFRSQSGHVWQNPRRALSGMRRLFAWGRRTGDALPPDLAPFQADHDRQREIFPAAELRKLLRAHLPVAPPTTFSVADGSEFGDPLTRFQAQDFKTYMVDDVLTKVDRMSMANSLEVRVPLLDHLLIELAFSMPTSMRMRQAPADDALLSKYALRRSAERFFTPEFLARPKRGFGIPIVEWCQGPLKPLIGDCLRDRNNPIYDQIDHGYVVGMLDRFHGGEDGLVARVWAVLMMDMWKRHVDGRR